MKKIMTIVLFSIIMASSCLFAVTDELGFYIRWKHLVSGTEVLSILNYAGDAPLENNTKDVDSIEERQNLAMVRLTTNIGGFNTFSFRATALQTQDRSSAVTYTLYIDRDGMVSSLQIGNDPGSTYPLPGMPTVATSFTVPNGISTPRSYDILLSAELTGLDQMKPGDLYSSVITIERVAN